MHQPPDTKATILISGEGTNLQALIDASSSTLPHLKIKVRNYKDNNGFEQMLMCALRELFQTGKKPMDLIEQERLQYPQII